MAGHTSWREIRAKRPPNPSAGKHERLKIKLALLHEQQGLAQTDLANTPSERAPVDGEAHTLP
jgi:hypothetical protein